MKITIDFSLLLKLLLKPFIWLDKLITNIVVKVSYWIINGIVSFLVVLSNYYHFWMNPSKENYSSAFLWLALVVTIFLFLISIQSIYYVYLYFKDKDRFLRAIFTCFSTESEEAADKFIEQIKNGVIKPPKLEMSNDDR